MVKPERLDEGPIAVGLGQAAQEDGGQGHGRVRGVIGPDRGDIEDGPARHPEPGPGPGPQSADDDRLTAVDGVAHHRQVAESLEQNADQGEPEQGGAVLGGDGRPEEPFARADARAREHDSRPDQARPIASSPGAAAREDRRSARGEDIDRCGGRSGSTAA